MELVNRCPMCGSTHWMRINGEKYDKYKFGGLLIQEAFPELNPHEREFIKTGYCPKCQELLFGIAYDGKKIK